MEKSFQIKGDLQTLLFIVSISFFGKRKQFLERTTSFLYFVGPPPPILLFIGNNFPSEIERKRERRDESQIEKMSRFSSYKNPPQSFSSFSFLSNHVSDRFFVDGVRFIRVESSKLKMKERKERKERGLFR